MLDYICSLKSPEEDSFHKISKAIDLTLSAAYYTAASIFYAARLTPKYEDKGSAYFMNMANYQIEPIQVNNPYTEILQTIEKIDSLIHDKLNKDYIDRFVSDDTRYDLISTINARIDEISDIIKENKNAF